MVQLGTGSAQLQWSAELVREHRIHYISSAGTWNDISCDQLNAVMCQKKWTSGDPLAPNGPQGQPLLPDHTMSTTRKIVAIIVVTLMTVSLSIGLCVILTEP